MILTFYKSIFLPSIKLSFMTCIDRGVTTHFLDWCWVKYLELWVKYSLCHIRIKGSNYSLRKAAASTEPEQKGVPNVLEMDSWQPKIPTIEDPRRNCWLVNSIIDIYICNNQSLMTKYQELPIKIRGSISDRISPGRERIRFYLALMDSSKGLVLNL